MDSYHLKYLIDIHVHLAVGNNNHYLQRKPACFFAGFSFKLAARNRGGTQKPTVASTKKATNKSRFLTPSELNSITTKGTF